MSVARAAGTSRTVGVKGVAEHGGRATYGGSGQGLPKGSSRRPSQTSTLFVPVKTLLCPTPVASPGPLPSHGCPVEGPSNTHSTFPVCGGPLTADVCVGFMSD